jgi:hypothetical protein
VVPHLVCCVRACSPCPPSEAAEYFAPIYESPVAPGMFARSSASWPRPHAGRSGMAPRNQRSFAMRCPRPRRAACGLRTPQNKLGTGAWPPERRNRGDRGCGRVARRDSRHMAVFVRPRLDVARSQPAAFRCFCCWRSHAGSISAFGRARGSAWSTSGLRSQRDRSSPKVRL